MAVYTQAAGDRQVAEYLYELNENLTYMFTHLTPEDNYSEAARLIYVQRGERIGSLEVRADAIELRVSENETKIATLTVRADQIEAKVADDERNYNTSVTLLADLLKLDATTPQGSSTVKMTGDKITLKTGKFIVDAKNLQLDAQGNATFSGTVSAASIVSSTISGGTISGTAMSASTISGGSITGSTMSANTISGGTISGTTMSASTISGNTITGGTISGTTLSGSTVSGNTITGGTISGTTLSGSTISGNTITGGTISGTTISGGTITGTSINGGDDIRFKARPGYLQFGDFEVDDSYGRHIFQSYDEVTGMSTGDASGGELLLWAGWDGDEAAFAVNANGGTHVEGNFYYKGTELRSLIISLINEYGGGGSGDDEGELVDPGVGDGGQDTPGGGGGPTGDENDPILGGG